MTNKDDIRIVRLSDETKVDFARTFCDLIHSHWRQRPPLDFAISALKNSVVLVAFNGDKVAACCRIVTDGHFFSAVAELITEARWQTTDLPLRLLEEAYQESPSGLVFAVQSANSEAMAKSGWL